MYIFMYFYGPVCVCVCLQSEAALLHSSAMMIFYQKILSGWQQSHIFFLCFLLFCPFFCVLCVFRAPGAVKQEKTSRNTETNSKINFMFGPSLERPNKFQVTVLYGKNKTKTGISKEWGAPRATRTAHPTVFDTVPQTDFIRLVSSKLELRGGSRRSGRPF